MKKIILLSLVCLLAANAAFAANSVAVTAAAAMGPNNGGTACGGGMCGLAVTLDGSTNPAKVVDNTPANESIYRADFWWDPNTLNMPDATLMVIARGTDLDLNRSDFQILVNHKSGLYRLSIRAGSNSAGVFKISPRITYDPACGAMRMQVEFEQSPAPGTPGGEVTVTVLETENACAITAGTFINTAQFHGVGINNSTLGVDDHHVGAVGNIPATTTGTFYVDEHRAFRTLAP